MLYKYPAVTKTEIIEAIKEIATLSREIHIDRSALNQQVGKIQSLADHLPEPEEIKEK